MAAIGPPLQGKYKHKCNFEYVPGPFKKKCLLEGLDDIALSLEKSQKMDTFEKNLKEKKPWIFND